MNITLNITLNRLTNSSDYCNPTVLHLSNLLFIYELKDSFA